MTHSNGDPGRRPAATRAGAGTGRSSRRRPGGASAANSADAYPSGLRWAGRHPIGGGPGNFLVSRWRWILFVALTVVGVATVFSYSRTPTYRSSADVLVQPRLFAAGTAPQDPDMGSERALAESTVVLQIAADALNVPVTALENGLSISVPLNTHLLHVAYASTDPGRAQKRAQAIAAAYVRYWVSEQPPLANSSAGQVILKSAVISAAKHPSTPASPKHNVDIAIAVLIGLAVGIGTAYLRDRMDDRLRGAFELERYADAPVLALMPPVKRLGGRRRSVLRERQSRGAVAYADLAALLLRTAVQRPAQTLLVTSPVGDAQTGASANLAAALAESGREVVLIQANLRWPADAAFGLDPERSLAAVLEGSIALTDAVQATSVPRLRVLPTGRLGGNVGAALHGTQLRHALRRLRSSADIVVIDGPPILAGADIATFTEMADLIVLVAHGRRTTRAQIRAAAEQLRPLGPKLVGCILENARGNRQLWTRRFTDGPVHRDVRSLRRQEWPAPTLPERPNAADAEPELEPPNGWTHAVPNGKR